MENKSLKKLIVIAMITAIVIATMVFCVARFVLLSPSCYANNKELTEQENYFIKKLVLEAIEDRLSIFANGSSNIYDSTATENEIISLDKTQNNPKHIFILINQDFMESVVKEHDKYTVTVNTYGMEQSSDDCSYIIHITKDFTITFFGLDP